ncbi:glucosylglycerol hydrolase [Pleurocapsa sp. PCC 7319]|uniref:glucosylglycerol hydrolase n=1 Tax=Pleurocapsa sp. PCC 7319 TaxID=118161 RepID=UPI0003455117|nr:glucosylglycerol hydrolase [Pleurocapsa sp. PCC 7319]
MKVEVNTSIRLVPEATGKLLAWASGLESSTNTYLEQTKALARKLGAYYRPDGLTEIGFWVPGLIRDVLHEREIYLEVFTPVEPIDWQEKEQTIKFRRDRVHLEQQGEYIWGVVAGMQPGNRLQAGSFYWLRYIDRAEKLRTIRDLVPHSLPYGIFAPAELYDIDSLQANRADLKYFRRTAKSLDPKVKIPRVGNPKNILQIHVGTASPEGTIEGLTRIYQDIAAKIIARQPLTPSEQNYSGYDAIELLPTEPTIEYRDEYSPESEFFAFVSEEEDLVEVELFKPNTQDWGYDVPILGSSTTNPALLSTLRPDEVIDFIATLHNFPTHPIQLIYDLVYGHADNQSELLIAREFLKGPNMYGQDLNHQLPMVRSILLEMQRRKINTGADGIRIDGGQDFRFFNPLSGRVEQDDAYLLEMSNIVQEVNEHKRLLFTIFEDGRPWPEEGWEEKSTYRELIELKPESYQWGSLIFAHNTPSVKGFWEKKWSRVMEVMTMGDHWITGCGNHDTVRRGNQINPQEQINWNLGKTLPEVIRNAYDNPGVTLWVNCFSPGLPMDFINATMHAPWLFFRNTDEQYGVKVVSEEVGFLDWQISPNLYRRSHCFPRLKSLGFKQLKQLKQFGKALHHAMIQQDYNLAEVVEVLRACTAPDTHCIEELSPLVELMRGGMVRFLKKLDEDRLKSFALMFMEDCYQVCNISNYESQVDPLRVKFNLTTREFRHLNPWLAHNILEKDTFDKINEEARTVIYGIRHNLDCEQAVAIIANFEGEPIKLNVAEILKLDLAEWQVAIATPDLNVEDLEDLTELTLSNSQGILLTRSSKPSSSNE